MNKEKIAVRVIKEDRGYSATVLLGDDLIGTEADTLDELKSSFLKVLNFAFEDEGVIYTPDDLAFEYDIESFFHFYRVINAKALSERIGMNQSLLAQYIKGIKKPSPAQKRRILNGVQQIGRELSEVRFLL